MATKSSLAEWFASMTPEKVQLLRTLGSIFTPRSHEKILKHYPDQQSRARFVHYTTADAALKIINSRRIWMRNAMCMADYREMSHGHDILLRVIDKARLDVLCAALDPFAPSAMRETVDAFNKQWFHIQWNTYITSFSEHDATEDLYGRLSMWRAFGGSSARVAIVISIPSYTPAVLKLNLIFSPVSYLTYREVEQELDAVATNIRAHGELLRTIDPQLVRSMIFSMLLTATTCMKHPGFSEEREWRALYEPMWTPNHPLVKRETECIGGVPQHVCKMPIDVRESEDIADLDFARIFDRLIIGPTQYPAAMGDAFVEALNNAGVENASQKVCASDIPIRT